MPGTAATSSTSGSPSTRRTAPSNVAYYDTGTHGATATLYTLARSTNGAPRYSASADRERADRRDCGAGVDLGNQYGDYEGIAALGGIVRPVWTDRRQA